MDAVSRLIFWQGDPARGVNGDTLDFLKNMNAGLKARHPSALLIAEDSTAFPGVTRPVSEGGLGFDYKWDLGWMHDTLTYMQTPPDERAERRGQLLFSMEYFPNEHYLLPLSHDEVVHGKAAIVQKMWGADLTDKYAQARAFYVYMFAHPGKKLNFMGNELGLRVEWSESAELDWTYIDGPFHTFFCALGKAYCEHPALHADYLPDSFRWLPENLDAPCVFAWERRSSDEHLIAVCNFSDKPYEFETDLPAPTVLLNTDWERFGGETKETTQSFNKISDRFSIKLAKFSAILLKIDKN